jgi:hypothetical protein
VLLERFKSTEFECQQLEVAKQIVALHDPTVVEQLTGLLEHENRHLRGNARSSLPVWAILVVFRPSA